MLAKAVNLPPLSPSAAIPQRRLSSRTSTPPAQAALSYLTFGVGGGRCHYGSRPSKHHVQGKQREYVMGNQTASLLRRENVARGELGDRSFAGIWLPDYLRLRDARACRTVPPNHIAGVLVEIH